MLAMYLKELRSYFTSAIGYVFIGTFLIITGIFFALSNLLSGSAYYNGVLSNINFIFIFIVPVLTMKLVSEETKTKTDQLLYTSPLKVTDIILGKYFAAITIFAVSVLITVLYPLILSMFGKVAPLEVLTGYIGLFLLGSSLIAIGLFVSSLTENQITAVVITFGAMLFIQLIDSIQSMLPSTRIASIIFVIILIALFVAFVYFSTKNLVVSAGVGGVGLIATLVFFLIQKTAFDGLLQKVFEWFSLNKRYDLFSQGILSMSSIVYYLSFCIAFVFLTVRVIDKRRWS